MSRALYNEIDPVSCAVLREAIARGIIAPGEVLECSIKDLTPNDLRGFEQVHLFAGAGCWSVAARQAGWADSRPLWSASCPCQPFSVVGQGKGVDDPRHLWPDLFRLIRACRPDVIVGEQVSGAPGYGWLDGVFADLAQENYASEAVDIPALAVDAPQQRNRLYWIAVGNSYAERGLQSQGRIGDIGRWARDADARRAVAGSDSGREAWGSIFGPGEGAGPDEQRTYDQPRGRDGCGGMVGANGRGRDGRPQDALGGSLGRDAAQRPDDGVDMVNAEGLRRGEGRPEYELRGGRVAAASADVCGALGSALRAGLEGYAGHGDRRPGWAESPGPVATPNGSFWDDHYWIECADGKARRAKPGLRLLVDGMAGRADLWRLAGNSIVAPLAVEAIAALAEALDS